MRIGVISDTHGYLDPRLADAFVGVDAILHAGDVGAPEVLAALRAMAPLHAVRGNNDERLGGLGLPLRRDLLLDGVRIHLVHEAAHARPPAGTRVLVLGHSHRVLLEREGALLRLNPGAAGRVGFHRVQTVALLTTARGAVRDARIIELGPRERSRRGGAAGTRTP